MERGYLDWLAGPGLGWGWVGSWPRGPAEGHGRSLTLSCSLSLESTSNRMSTGSVRPEVGNGG